MDLSKDYKQGYTDGTIDTYAEKYLFDLKTYVEKIGVQRALEEVMKIGLLLEKEKDNESV